MDVVHIEDLTRPAMNICPRNMPDGVASMGSCFLGQQLTSLHLCVMGCILGAPAAQGMKHPPVRAQRACHWRAPALPSVCLHHTEQNMSMHCVVAGACSLGWLTPAILAVVAEKHDVVLLVKPAAEVLIDGAARQGACRGVGLWSRANSPSRMEHLLLRRLCWHCRLGRPCVSDCRARPLCGARRPCGGLGCGVLGQ